MKAVVVELNKDRAAVLSDDGCVISVRNNNYEVGQIIQMNYRKNSIVKKFSVLAASAAAMLFLGTATWAYASPYTYVSVDVNPSIEFSVNRFDRVIKVKAVNDDGEEILDEISLGSLTHKSIENAIKSTVNQISEAGYFDGDIEGGIIIATSSKDSEKANDLAEELQNTAEQAVISNSDNVVVEAYSVGPERVQEARELGVTPGKLNLVEKLKEAAGDTEEVSIDEWLDKPVKEIMKATKEYKNVAKDTNKESEPDPGKEQQQTQGNDTKASENDEQMAQNQEDKDLKEAEKEADKAQKEAAKEEEKADKETAKEEEKAEKEAAKEEGKSDKENKNQQKNSAGSSKNDKSNINPTVTPAAQISAKPDETKKKNEKDDKSSKKEDKSTKNDTKKNGENNADINASADNGNNDLNSGSETAVEDNNPNKNDNTAEDSQGSDHKSEGNNKDVGDPADKANQNSEVKADNSQGANETNLDSSNKSESNIEQSSNNGSDNNSQNSNSSDENGQGSDNNSGKNTPDNKGKE